LPGFAYPGVFFVTPDFMEISNRVYNPKIVYFY
jgi:hypothetical protein